MALNRFMKKALKALSFPDVDIRKIYTLDRSVRYLKSPPILHALYKRYDHVITTEQGQEVLTRVYTPKECIDGHTLLFFHGGGWVTENIDTYHRVCRALARATKSRVVSVEYRLAPEHPFPQGLDDCYEAAREMILHPERFDFDPGLVTLIGDSAGGNLAAAVSLRARDEGLFQVQRQILIYPATGNDHSEHSPFRSVIENGRDYLLTASHVQAYLDLYKRSEEDLSNPYLAPLMASDYSRQPRTLLITAQYDPLRDEGEEYAKRLQQAGNQVTLYRMKDALHGFMGLGPRYVHVRRTHRLINEFIYDNENEMK